jgi:hypothetical protein
MCSALALAGFGGRAFAQVPGGGGRAECQVFTGPGPITNETGGLFVAGPGSCVNGGVTASIQTKPFVLLQAVADASAMGSADRSGDSAIVELQYNFTLTGGTAGDDVPLLIHTIMNTSATASTDGNGNANIASAGLNLFGLACPGCDTIVRNDASKNVCTFSPDDSGCTSSFDGDLALTMKSGAGERVFMQIILASSAKFAGVTSASIDPFIFIDPSFAHAGDYQIVVDSAVANALPPDNGGGSDGVPEPATWALMLAGFGGLGVAMRRRRSVAA